MEAFARELEIAADLARRAGRLALDRHGADIAVERKLDDEVVTAVDRLASELILEGLGRAFPGDVLVSEESPPPAAWPPEARVWFVDPIDGTLDFIEGREGYSVMIGLVIGGRPRLGAVYQPVLDRLLLGVDDQGARLRTAAGDRPVRCSIERRIEKLRLVASRSRYNAWIDRAREALGVTDVVRVGSLGVKAALIAMGERDLYLNPWTDCKVWDTCAPEAILRAAGGEMTDLTGAPLRYSPANFVNRTGIIASNGVAHEGVVARLRALVASA
jgi:3'(2'), 5'-bisphosphate nucleotidase